MPSKGDIITLDSKLYRVLKVNGTVAEVLAMYNASRSIEFDSGSGRDDLYAGKSIDTYCNETFYGRLSSTMKSAIIDKTFTQDAWKGGVVVPTEAHYTGTYVDDGDDSTYYLTLANAAYGESITRHCYCLSVQDVLDYLDATTSMSASDTTLTHANIIEMFWGSSADRMSSWLRSACSTDPDDFIDYEAFVVTDSHGDLFKDYVDSTLAVRPAFQIDLSKIEWTPVGDN